MVEVLFVLFIVLVVVAGLGHGLWCLAAAVLRAISGEADPPTSRCSKCGQVKTSPRRPATTNVASSVATASADLFGMSRQLDRFRQKQALNEKQFTWLKQLVLSELSTRTDSPLLEVTGPPALSKPPVVEPDEGIVVLGSTGKCAEQPSHGHVVAEDLNVSPVEAAVVSAVPTTTSVPVVEAETVDKPPVIARHDSRTCEPVAPGDVRCRELSASESRDSGGSSPPLTDSKLPSHPLDRTEDTELRPALKPRRTLADLLQAFMEEKNIRWGELLSGLLIVGSAVGLVISLRHTLSSAIPYFPALLFMLGTAAIHAVGNYTLRRWKLESTSRGVLLIATLLIPLNFLAAIVISGTSGNQFSASDLRYWLAVVLGVLSFGTMTHFAGRALMRDGWWRMWVAVMGTSVGQLLISRLVSPSSPTWHVLVLGLLPAGAVIAATAHQLWRARNWRGLTTRRADQLLMLIGVATFSLAAVVALLIYKSSDVAAVLTAMSPAAAAYGGILLGYGLLIHFRTTSEKLSKTKTVGTTLAVFAGLGLAGSVALAWPDPALLIAVGLTLLATLSSMAMVSRTPWLYSAAIAGATLSTLVSVHCIVGHVGGVGSQAEAMLDSLLTDETSITFTILALLVGIVGWWAGRTRNQAESLVLFWSSTTLAGLGVTVAAISSLYAWPIPSYPLATLVLLVNAVALLVAARRLRVPWISWCGSLLFWAGLVHAALLNAPIQKLLTGLGVEVVRPVVAATLLHASLMTAIATIVWRGALFREEQTGNDCRKSFAIPLLASALISSSLTLPFVFAVWGGHFGVHAMYLAIVALVWLMSALTHADRVSFTVFQVLATGSLVLFVCWAGQTFRWWDGSPTSLILIAVQLAVMACWCMLWTYVRKRLSHTAHGARLLKNSALAVERILLRALTAAIALLALLTCLPSVVFELNGDWPSSSWLIDFSASILPLWCAFALVTAATVVSVTRQSLTIDLVWLLLILFAAPWLAISQLQGLGITTTMLCWTMAGCGLAFSLVYALRETLLRLISGQSQMQLSEASVGTVRAAILSFSGLPLMLLVLCQFGLVLSGGTVDHAFLAITGPLFVAALMLVGFAIRDRQQWPMMSGSATVLSGVVLGMVAERLSTYGLVDMAACIQLTQWLCIAAGTYALGWLGLRQLIPSVAPHTRDSLLNTQITLSVGLVLALAFGGAIGIAGNPAHVPAVVTEFGQPLSYLGLALTLIALLWHTGTAAAQHRTTLIGATLVVLGTMAAASLVSLNSASEMISYHVLELTHVLVAVSATIGLVVTRCKCGSSLELAERRPPNNRLFQQNLLIGWGSATGFVAVLLALRVYWIDPQVNWALTVLWICCAVTIAIGLLSRSVVHALASLVLVCLSTTLSCPSIWLWGGRLDLLAYWNLISLAGVSGIWLVAAVLQQRQGPGESPIRVHQVVAVGGCVLITLLTGFELCADWFSKALGTARAFDPTLFASGLAALTAIAGLTIGSVWDRRATSPLPCLYSLAFPVMFFVLRYCGISTDSPLASVVGLNLGMAMLVVVSGFILGKRERLVTLAGSSGIPAALRRGEQATVWLPAVNLVVSCVVVLLSLTLVLTFDERWMRFAAAASPLVCGVGFALTASQVRNGLMRMVSVLLFTVSLAFVGWADIAPSVDAATILERCVRLLISLSASVMVFLVVARRLSERSSAWLPTLRKAAILAGGLAVALLVLILGIELATFAPGTGAAVNHPYQVFAVGIALAGLVAALIAMACRPAKDPLNLSERGRMVYVYGAEAVAALFFAHLYLVRPGWFELVQARYWPFGLMALAFVGVGIGELFQRLKLQVLAEPLQRTSAFLPLIPVAAFWVLADHERLSFEASGISYAAVLVVIGLLYVLLGVLRRSFASAVAAAVAGNAALWVFFHDNAFRVTEHPQFWLIPPALSLLAAAQINRRSLPDATLAAIRYACILLIYLSSTTEMIIESASQQLWPPMVLAVLALIGAFAGIVMRVRAFLYIGSTFVLLSVVSMVWHAARAIEHVWPWWAFGMATGLFILALFGMFELKRTEVKRLIDRLRQWDR